MNRLHFLVYLRQTYLLILFLIFSTEQTDVDLVCHKTFVLFQNYCYYFSNQQLDFPGSERVCNNYTCSPSSPCHLTSIHSEEENSFVYEQALRLWGPTYYWLGATWSTRGNYDNFSWIDGSPMDFFTYFRPDSRHGSCLQNYQKNRWDDTYCTIGPKKYFVCKKTATKRYSIVSLDLCSSNLCKNGGTCNTVNSTFSCECRTEFSGDTCEISDYNVFRRRAFIFGISIGAVCVFLGVCTVFGCGVCFRRNLLAKGKDSVSKESHATKLELSNPAKSIGQGQDEIRCTTYQQEPMYSDMLDSDSINDQYETVVYSRSIFK